MARLTSAAMNDIGESGQPPSLWAATATPAPPTVPLDGAADADVVVVGAGLTGCSTALHLAERGTSVILLEAHEIGSGASGRNMGLVNPHFRVLPTQVSALLGEELGGRMNAVFAAGGDTVFGLIKRHEISCDAVRTGNIEVSFTKRGLAELRATHDERLSLGAPFQWLERNTLAEMTGCERYAGGYIDRGAGGIQPLSYVRGLARAALGKGARIHTRSAVNTIAKLGDLWRVTTDRGQATARHVVVAADAYTEGVMPEIRAAMVPMWTHIGASEPLSPNLRRTIMPGGQSLGDNATVPRYYRIDRDGRLVVVTLGRAARSVLSPLSDWDRKAMSWAFPHTGAPKIVYRWQGVLGISPNHLPFVHEPEPSFHVPLGYSGRGITSATVMGKILADRILGQPSGECPVPLFPLAPAPYRLLHGLYFRAALYAGRLVSMVR